MDDAERYCLEPNPRATAAERKRRVAPRLDIVGAPSSDLAARVYGAQTWNAE
jgi:hypothetical protein